MKKQIIARLRQRIDEEITPRARIKYLKEHDISIYIDSIVSIVYLYTRPKKGDQKAAIYLAEVICALGHAVRAKLRQKRDSAMAARTGAFILYTFEELGLLQVTMGASANGHGQYVVQVLKDDEICAMWETVTTAEGGRLPADTPYAPWTTVKHATGAMMVKTQHRGVLDSISPERQPMLFECLNRAQKVGWLVNKDIYDIYKWALRNKTDAFSEIWEQSNPEARTTKLREATAIGSIAQRFIGKAFYHLYYYDFRGRKYPTTAYLHEQGSDLARGLLYRADKKVIGKDGFEWLLISIASNWAGDAGRDDKQKTDKIPLQERADWAKDNEEILLAYAESPKVNQGWMKADKPWQFLAGCVELMKFRIWQVKATRREIMVEGRAYLTDPDFNNCEFESSLECYIDGSNNGSQHLAALTRDDITAPHVNLVPLELPGDLYKYVGDHVWETIDKAVKSFQPEDVKAANVYIDTLIEYKKQITQAEPKSLTRAEFVEKMKAYREANSHIANKAATVFWLRITDAKQRRKVVKRNVMTLPYGGTSYGLGEQQISDAKKHGIDLLYNMEHKWGAYMGREVYEDCKVSLERPMQLLDVFEAAGRAAEVRGKFLSWTTPITNFPVVQNYTQGIVKKLWIQYGPPAGARDASTGHYSNELQLAICFIEETVPSKGKQASGASPNAIHSLDATHLTLTVNRCDFPVTTIHDSFGCLLADMPDLFRIVRESFVELYESDPLMQIMDQIDGDLSGVSFGTLDIRDILKSEYAFS